MKISGIEKIKTKLEYYRRFLIVKKGNNVSKFMSYKETLYDGISYFHVFLGKKEVLQKSLFYSKSLLRNIFSRHSVKLLDKLEVKLEIFC